MKSLLVLILSLIATTSWAEQCKTGDIADCAKVLTKLHNAKVPPRKFANAFDEICGANAKFKCIKRTVRGDIKEEMKYATDEMPKAHMFEVRLSGENYIYILDAK